MPRPYPSNRALPSGRIAVEQTSPTKCTVYFTPPKAALRDEMDPRLFKTVIMEVDGLTRIITLIPYKVWGETPMQLKYYSLAKIRIDYQYLGEVPKSKSDVDELIALEFHDSLVQDYNYGFGFRKDYRFIVHLIERLGVTEATISRTSPTTLDESSKTMTINWRDLSRMQRNIDRITQKAREISIHTKSKSTDLLLQRILITDLGDRSAKQNHDQLETITSAHSALSNTSKSQQEAAAAIVERNGSQIFKREPRLMLKLRSKIELLALEDLITKLREMINAKVPESTWQKLFRDNPLVLSTLFGVPIVSVRDQAVVGGQTISGGGEKIVDFLVKNSLTNNAAIVEIKTPSTKLMSSRPYRLKVFGPSNELGCSVSQVLDQIYNLQRHIVSLKGSSDNLNLETYSVSGVLIIGKYPEDKNLKNSFELFRGSLKNIQIITFDELLTKLDHLHKFLAEGNS